MVRVSFNHELKGDVFIPKESNGKTIVFLGGLPSYLYKNKISQALVDQGFTVIQPFYYGSWVSGGDFNPKNCWKTLEDTIQSLEEGNIRNLYSDEKLEVEFKDYYVMGTREIISEFITKHNLQSELHMVEGGHSLDSMNVV